MNQNALEFDEQIVLKPTIQTQNVPDKYWEAINKVIIIRTIGIKNSLVIFFKKNDKKIVVNSFRYQKKTYLKPLLDGAKTTIFQNIIQKL